MVFFGLANCTISVLAWVSCYPVLSPTVARKAVIRKISSHLLQEFRGSRLSSNGSYMSRHSNYMSRSSHNRQMYHRRRKKKRLDFPRSSNRVDQPELRCEESLTFSFFAFTSRCIAAIIKYRLKKPLIDCLAEKRETDRFDLEIAPSLRFTKRTRYNIKPKLF